MLEQFFQTFIFECRIDKNSSRVQCPAWVAMSLANPAGSLGRSTVIGHSGYEMYIRLTVLLILRGRAQEGQGLWTLERGGGERSSSEAVIVYITHRRRA